MKDVTADDEFEYYEWESVPGSKTGRGEDPDFVPTQKVTNFG